ncbi:unnamed protein product [Durusdinium trenchii]|uniref:Transposase IS4-like domain-containing protein n=1 Tax=Durusdinium trenchii TaxID=1381693 RepID=A0ABP0PRU1_9DINO
MPFGEQLQETSSDAIVTDRGFTTASTFLEAVRFSKFTVGLRGCDSILQAGRILGFAAIERREKGPTKQAPILELVHLRKLHEILLIGCDPVDRLGAGEAQWWFIRRSSQ